MQHTQRSRMSSRTRHTSISTQMQRALRQCRKWHLFFSAFAVAAVLAISIAGADGPAPNREFLRIGTSGCLTAGRDAAVEKAALDELRNLIKTETGLENQIVRQQGWRELADKMTDGQLQLGIFQGYEFAWVQEQRPDFRPLALAVNVDRYPVVNMIARRDNPVHDFAGLEGHSLALADTGQRDLRLFVDRSSKANGKDPESFFSKIIPEDNFEDGLDDVVDNVVQTTVVDQATLEAYERRKPGRFRELKVVVRSQPLPPTVVAYPDKALNDATLRRLREGLLRASSSDKGQTVMGLFRLTGFDAVPADFEQVLAQARKAYPPVIR
jgi:ABC-type phosphate/phosphonate transport system substrate-binding protein